MKRIYPHDLFIVNEKYCGFGLSDNLNLDIHDLVYVIKHSDPCGNPDHWFVDNGSKFHQLCYAIYAFLNFIFSKQRYCSCKNS